MTPDAIDTDSDGAGIPDKVEAGDDPTSPLDSDNDGAPDHLDTDADGDGVNDATETCGDSDSDGISDYLDNDADNDGFFDIIEARIRCRWQWHQRLLRK